MWLGVHLPYILLFPRWKLEQIEAMCICCGCAFSWRSRVWIFKTLAYR